MNDKEKLISLLILTDPNPYTCESESGSCELTTCTECRARSTADLLIANGVTVHEWISVDDRLPKKDEIVIICTDKNFIYAGELVGDTWFLDNDSWTETVTHWMPLPQPPKGE